jgi:serine/threonine-protein kinase
VIVANKYALTSQINEGGCGVIYLARHIRLKKDHERVIKFIKPEFTNEKAIKRLEREVEVTASLSQKNEHIVRVYDDFGHIASLGSYYIMEFLQGEDLADLLARFPHPLPVKTIFKLLKQTCQGLIPAHDDGVIHRDLKPQNIYLTTRGDEDQFVKVIDFGIAKDIEQQQTKLTQGMLGTPEYMAPEQCTGSDISPATDVYALGIILFELLTGHTPFLPPGRTIKNPVEIVLSHLQDTPPTLQESTTRNLPATLQEIVSRCLDKAPQKRYQHARDLLRALEQAEQETTTTTAPPAHPTLPTSEETSLPDAPSTTTPHPTHTTELPNRTPYILMALVGVLSIALVAAFAWKQTSTPTTKHTKTLPTNRPTQPDMAPKKQATQAVPDIRPEARPTVVTKRKSSPTPRTKPQIKRRKRYKIARRFKRKRRTRKQTPNKRQSPCPSTRGSLEWLILRRIPAQTSIASSYNTIYKGKYICIQRRKGQRLQALTASAPGYANCIIPSVSPSRKQATIRLIRPNKNKGLSMPFGYCFK